MTLASKFRKDLSTLQAAVNKKFSLTTRNRNYIKNLERHYVSQGLAILTDEDPDYDYNIIIDCIAKI